MGRPKKEKPNHGNMYEVKVTVGHNFDGTLIRKSFYSSISKADARAKAEQYKINQAVQERTGETPEPKVITFETWAKKWLETYKKDTVKQHTYLYTYESNVMKYLIPYFKKAKMSEIKQIDIQKYFNTVHAENGQPLAKSTLDKQKMILKDMFDAAIDNDLCFKNPVKNIRYQHVAEKEERNVYTKAQADAAENYARQHEGHGVVIMMKTGIRRSELLGLQWTDIDFENLWIHIQRAVVQTRGQIVIAPPKTATSDRFIPISEDLAEYLKAMPHNGIYVMGTNDPLSPSTYAKSFSDFMKQMSEEINIPVLTPHELRHTFGTLLREDGVDIYTIQRIMGHSDISVTTSVYVHNNIAVLRRQMGLSDVD